MVRLVSVVGVGIFLILLLSTARQNLEYPSKVALERNDLSLATSTATLIATSTSLEVEEEDASLHDSQNNEEVPALVDQPIVKTSPVTRVSSSPIFISATSSAKTTSSIQPDTLNQKARSVLVNILCEASSPLRSTSGSGVMIDPRGIILTNAHIAQYFLLEDSFSVSCTVRSGSPATAQWHARLIFIPEQWVKKHAEDILISRATGTGEHDYAFLAITESINDSPLPQAFSFIPMNIGEAASVPGNPVLVAGYPAEFIGGSAARSSLYASTVFSSVKQLLTFTEDAVDVISVEGTVLAQSGSSGGSFMDLFGSLVGLIVTTSRGDTTGTRDLHAITPAHIDRSVQHHMGVSVHAFLSKELPVLLAEFAPMSDTLSKTLRDAIQSRQH